MRLATVAVIGIGRIGLPVTAALVRAGYRVRATDVNPDVSDAVHSAGAQWCPDLSDVLFGADLVLTVLPGSPELEQLVLGPPALLDQLDAGAVWVDFTSAAPDLGTMLQRAAAERGIGYLDAPLGGGPDAARTASLTLYVGGDAAVLEQARPALDSVASTVRHVGPSGAGYLTKLLVNLVWFDQAVAVGEALTLARRAGLDDAVFAEVLPNSPAASDFLRDYLPRALAGDVVANFGLDRIVEELDSLTRLADALGVGFLLGTATADVHRAALRRYGPRSGELLAITHLTEPDGPARGGPEDRQPRPAT